MPHFNAEKLLLALVLITIIVVVFREPLLKERFVIEPHSANFRTALDEDVQDGGNSTAAWTNRNNLEWRCELKSKFGYPFCGMQIYFSDSYLEGLDFSLYTHMNIELDYHGPAQSFRLYFRNSNPYYTREGEIRSTKFNLAEINISEGPRYENVKLEHFRVADWWLQLYPLPMAYTQIEFDNVGLIEIQTGTDAPLGEHIFKLRKIEVVGYHLNNEQLYFSIILCWIVAIVLYLASRIWVLKLALRAGRKRQAELTEINTLLDQRHKILAEKIKLDPLTGAYNREGIEESLKEAFRKWNVDKKPLALLLFDVDNFKKINDTHGHAIGDTVLREISGLVNDNIRGSDRLVRWGGEEFIIVCANTGIDQAFEFAEKLRRCIDSACFVDKLHVTVSFGVAVIRKGESLESLFQRTDLALYVAKNGGRNRVAQADL